MNASAAKPVPASLGGEVRRRASSPLIDPIFGDSLGIRPALLVLPTQVTHAQATSCLNMLLNAERAENPGQTTVVVDASQLSRFDSSVLAVLIECRREALRIGKSFIVHGIPARLAELARLYGVADLLIGPPADAKATP